MEQTYDKAKQEQAAEESAHNSNRLPKITMNEQKPVAEVRKTYTQKDEFTLQAVFYQPYDVKNADKLFTADQLKSEREKAIRECAEICNKLSDRE